MLLLFHAGWTNRGKRVHDGMRGSWCVPHFCWDSKKCQLYSGNISKRLCRLIAFVCSAAHCRVLHHALR